MFWKKPGFDDKYFDTLNRFFQFEKRTHFFEVDFSKPWYYVFLKKKFRYFSLFLSEAAQSIFESLVPIALGFAISKQNYTYMFLIVLGYIVLEILNRLTVYFNGITTSEIQGSIALSAHTFFLTVDPIFHSTKSSGSIISKIQSGSGRDFNMMINGIFFHVLPALVSYATVTITLVYFNLYLGVVATIFFVIITTLTSVFRYINSNALVAKWIKVREKYAGVTTENLVQNSLIRSSFATVETLQKTKELASSAHNVRNVMFMGSALVTMVSRILYILSVLFIGYGLLDLVQKGSVNSVLATTAIITYMAGSRGILRIGDTVGDITESLANIRDLFDFIRNFGKQTFPVLPEEY
jgi:ABC-type multidrug transport system fused ATPase/permease subunit